jgi:predicted DNA-binding WGR domain protein
VGVRGDVAWPTTSSPVAAVPAPGPATSASQPARRFELVEGSANKFWEVARDGCTVTVRYGRIGSVGQARTRELASEELAWRHAEELIEEKVARGYRERDEA